LVIPCWSRWERIGPPLWSKSLPANRSADLMKECPTCRRCFADDANYCGEDGDFLTSTLVGDTVIDGRYRLLRRLGKGGMGTVYFAQHVFLKTFFAIKVILPELIRRDPTLTTRFRQEARAAASIKHPNVVAVSDFGILGGNQPFLVMEFLNGPSLEDIVTNEKAMPVTRALHLFAQIAAGVSAAHQQQIIHRDLKPLNIVVQDPYTHGELVKILDFGLAKIKSTELLGSLMPVATDAAVGTPSYMAPEQWFAEECDERTDIYSLGIILFQLLTGEVPFKGTTIPSIMNQHLSDPPPWFSSYGVHVSSRLEALVRRMLEKSPDDRPQSVDNVLAEIKQMSHRFDVAKV
jgi:eukaryotic-like serine/threonine-protein kinase